MIVKNLEESLYTADLIVSIFTIDAALQNFI